MRKYVLEVTDEDNDEIIVYPIPLWAILYGVKYKDRKHVEHAIKNRLPVRIISMDSKDLKHAELLGDELEKNR